MLLKCKGAKGNVLKGNVLKVKVLKVKVLKVKVLKVKLLKVRVLKKGAESKVEVKAADNAKTTVYSFFCQEIHIKKNRKQEERKGGKKGKVEQLEGGKKWEIGRVIRRE